MKKTYSIFVSFLIYFNLFFILALIGCGTKSDTTDTGVSGRWFGHLNFYEFYGIEQNPDQSATFPMAQLSLPNTNGIIEGGTWWIKEGNPSGNDEAYWKLDNTIACHLEDINRVEVDKISFTTISNVGEVNRVPFFIVSNEISGHTSVQLVSYIVNEISDDDLDDEKWFSVEIQIYDQLVKILPKVNCIFDGMSANSDLEVKDMTEVSFEDALNSVYKQGVLSIDVDGLEYKDILYDANKNGVLEYYAYMTSNINEWNTVKSQLPVNEHHLIYVNDWRKCWKITQDPKIGEDFLYLESTLELDVWFPISVGKDDYSEEETFIILGFEGNKIILDMPMNIDHSIDDKAYQRARGINREGEFTIITDGFPDIYIGFEHEIMHRDLVADLKDLKEDVGNLMYYLYNNYTWLDYYQNLTIQEDYEKQWNKIQGIPE